MRTGLAATVAVLLIPLLAGCAADEGGDAGLGPLQTTGLPPADLEAGRFYSFQHGGGLLTFTLAGTGDAAFDLYDGQDTRLGTVGFTSDPPRSGLHRIEGVAAGELVLRLATLNGTLRIQSGSQAVDEFRPLALHVERVVLASNPGRAEPLGPVSIVGLTPGQPADERAEVQLQRVPADLRVLATGPAANLSVEVRSDRGPVLRIANANVQTGAVLATTIPGALSAVPASLTLQNLRDGALTAHVTASDLAGPVLLESTTYSRAQLPGPAPAGPSPATVPFSYGVLPEGPQAFAVHADARRLVLWQEGAGPDGADAAVALFGPRDERIGVVLVPPVGSVQVGTLGAGDYVAVVLAGRAALGADRAPADFQLRPLDVARAVAPASSAGGADRAYALMEEQVTAERVYAVEPAELAGDSEALPLRGCDAGRLIVVQQGGETVLASIEPENPNMAVDASPFLDATQALGAGPYVVLHDGFGDDGCGRPAVGFLSYLRP